MLRQELEDRGLLEGGGAVPSYYTSMKQKGRRVLELQPRAHRLLERGKEVISTPTYDILDGLISTFVAVTDQDPQWRAAHGSHIAAQGPSSGRVLSSA